MSSERSRRERGAMRRDPPVRPEPAEPGPRRPGRASAPGHRAVPVRQAPPRRSPREGSERSRSDLGALRRASAPGPRAVPGLASSRTALRAPPRGARRCSRRAVCARRSLGACRSPGRLREAVLARTRRCRPPTAVAAPARRHINGRVVGGNRPSTPPTRCKMTPRLEAPLASFVYFKPP